MEHIIFIYIATFAFGIIIGSFLNVCIFRMPDKMDIVSKRSHCFGCGNVLNWFELIPVISYLIQGGRCRHCKRKLSVQYPLIETLNGLLYVWVVAVHGLTVRTIGYCLCISVLIVISMIDWRTFEIPPGCNIFIGIIGLACLVLDRSQWYDYLWGFISVSGPLLIIYWISRGRGIGGGDIKLMAAAGLLLGWQKNLLALFIGAAVGSVIHIALMRIAKKDRVLAFGPYLSVGILIAILYGDWLIGWYLNTYIY
jgi:leader peptidase (prepilin peptidase)/N-methyltransferase